METEKQKKKIPKKILIPGIIVGILLLLVIAFFIVFLVGKAKLGQKLNGEVEMMDAQGSAIENQTVEFEGKKYRYNTDLVNILFMGIDRDGELEVQTELGNSGQADCLFLCSFDTNTGKMQILNVPRDMMTDVNVYSGQSGFVGTQKKQLCLAYGYGDGKEVSCKNTALSVTRLLYGIPINSYVAISLAAIPILNDAVGGVEVTIPAEYVVYDKSVKAGQRVTLMGDKAERFVRMRDSESGDINANTYRIARQKDYLLSFISKFFSEMKKDITLPVNMFNSISGYVCTDLDITQITYLATEALTSGVAGYEIKSIPYEIKMGDYVEYHADNKALYKLIIELFYKEVE